MQSSHGVTCIFSILGKLIYSCNSFHFHSSRHRDCWDLWPYPFVSIVSVSDIISLYWRLGALPWTSAIALCGDRCPQGMLEVDGLVTLTLNASGLLCWTASLHFHTLPLSAAVGCHFTSSQVSQPLSLLALFYTDCQNDGSRVDPPLLKSQVYRLYDSHFLHRRNIFAVLPLSSRRLGWLAVRLLGNDK